MIVPSLENRFLRSANGWKDPRIAVFIAIRTDSCGWISYGTMCDEDIIKFVQINISIIFFENFFLAFITNRRSI